MTVDEIRDRIAEIDEDDDEQAHMAEDKIWVDTLEAIAGGADNPRELASAALGTRKLEFERWYA